MMDYHDEVRELAARLSRLSEEERISIERLVDKLEEICRKQEAVDNG